MSIKTDGLRHLITGLFLAAVFVTAGCAAQKAAVVPDQPPAAQAQAPAKGEGSVIKSVSVVGDGDAVLIEATRAVKYTAFGLTNPARVIIDIPAVDLKGITSPVHVGNDLINDITASMYGEGEESIGRIEIGLKEGTNYEVRSGDESILVELSKAAGLEGVEGAAAPEDVVKAREEAPTAAAPPQAMEEKAAAAGLEEAGEKPVSAAKIILDVNAAREGGLTVVRILSDGSIGNYNTFGLDDPARVVLDVWDVGSIISRRTIPVGVPMLDRIRVGAHQGKVRFVFDLTPGKVPSYTVTKVDGGLVVAFGEKEALGNAYPAEEKAPPVLQPVVQPIVQPALVLPSAPGAVEKRKEEEGEGSVTVKKVDFKKLKDRARLTVVNSAKTGYEVKESLDGRTLTVDINDAVIPEELKLTLDATGLNTPVLTISSYQASTLPQNNVRVLVRLQEKTSYEVAGDNGTINVDFPLRPQAAGKMEEKEAAEEPMAPAEGVTPPEEKYTGRRISIDMADAKIADVLKLLAEVSNLNIIASEDVRGTMTLRLTDVPWDQTFDLILKTKGLDKIQEGNIVRVAPVEKIRQDREAVLAAKKAAEKLEELETEYIRVNYDKAVVLSGQVKTMLTDRGSVTVHETTNTLIIKDIRSAIEDAEAYIKKVDIPIPQVLIEARIVEAETSFARDLGIQWGMEHQATTGKVMTSTFGSSSGSGQWLPATGGTPPVPKEGFLATTGVTNYVVNLPASGTAGTLGAIGFILGKAGVDPLILDLRISAGEQEGLVRTISRPRIVTMNNKEAKIEQGESIPFETTSATGTQTMFIDANLSLTVTPQITPDGSVLMQIKASRNSIGSFRSSGGEPSINKKEAATNVLVKDGETTVIGGIIVSDTSRSERGIPYFKGVPVLGWLFKAKSISDSQKELLIFITPTIVKEKVS